MKWQHCFPNFHGICVAQNPIIPNWKGLYLWATKFTPAGSSVESYAILKEHRRAKALFRFVKRPGTLRFLLQLDCAKASRGFTMLTWPLFLIPNAPILFGCLYNLPTESLLLVLRRKKKAVLFIWDSIFLKSCNQEGRKIGHHSETTCLEGFELYAVIWEKKNYVLSPRRN